ncbi:hypothetical protein WDV06_00230 [Streptomyces racemochromogenes]|uniref:Uncharacterized protein n=1 Tax=Streptomyces racemochromogenes TaxID=67353 RepID=A0ABW7P5B8_9ACTN
MSTATFTPIQGGRPRGATAIASHHPRHRVGDALRAVKVFAAAAVSVVVLGEYSDYSEHAEHPDHPEDTAVIRR